MKISLIAAIAQNMVIGKDNELPWHLPADLRYFKKVTLGKPVVMGRKTYESIGRPLPKRRNIIISSIMQPLDIYEVYPSLQDALQVLQDEEEVMVIGGAQLFKEAMPLANKLYLTVINTEVKGDAYFPLWADSDWIEEFTEQHKPDKENYYEYSFMTLRRRAAV